MVQVAVIAAVATIIGVVLSVTGFGYKIGKWKQDMDSDNDDMRKAHSLVHEDAQKIVNKINGFNVSTRQYCDICQEAEDD